MHRLTPNLNVTYPAAQERRDQPRVREEEAHENNPREAASHPLQVGAMGLISWAVEKAVGQWSVSSYHKLTCQPKPS